MSSSCPRFFLLLPGISVTVSIHLITSTAVLKTPALLLRPGFGIRSRVLSQRPLSSKLNSFFPISADEKGATSVFRVLANHSASFFFLHPVRRFIRTTISIQYIPFFIHPVTECKHLLAVILTQICYFGREELAYIPYSSFNRQSLAAC